MGRAELACNKGSTRPSFRSGTGLCVGGEITGSLRETLPRPLQCSLHASKRETAHSRRKEQKRYEPLRAVIINRSGRNLQLAGQGFRRYKIAEVFASAIVRSCEFGGWKSSRHT